ncbi:MAG TPA: PAS domain S-box protein, partial [Anaerolineae bacterium]|nr:PAS domain S-box protein [Anaerolineae bacterium]
TRQQNEQLSALLAANARLLEETEKALQQVSKSEERYRTLLERAGDAIFVLDARGDYLEANPSACQLLGYTKEELLKLNVRDVLAGEGKEEFLQWLAAPEGQNPYSRELQQVHRDGNLVWTELRATPLGDSTYQAIGRDIRDRKALEKEREEYALRLAQEVQERTAELSALFQVARTLTSTLNLEEILSFIAAQATVLLGVPHSHVFFYDPAREEMVGQVSHGWEGDIRGKRIPLVESPLLREVFRQGRPVVIDSTYEAQSSLLCDLLRAGAALAAPMLVRGKILGLLLFVAEKGPRPFPPQEIRLAANLANLAGMALENVRLYEEARQKAKQIAQEKRQIDGILNSTADGLIVLDTAGRLLLANPVAARMLGFDLKEALGEQIGGEKLNNLLWLSLLALAQRYVPEASAVWEIPDFLHLKPVICWEERECTRKGCSLHGTTGRYCWLESEAPPGNLPAPIVGETLSQSKVKSFCLSCPLFQDLPRLYIEAKATPLRDEEGDVTGTVITMRDITALKEVERLKTQFISNVSHELRTPLSVIKLHADNFLRYYGRLDDERRMEMMRTIKSRADSLHNLIEDVLNLARIDAGREPKIESFNLAALCREVLAEMENIAQVKGLALERAIPPEPLVIEADREQISQVVRNLLSNALKFTPEGGEVSLRLNTKQRDGFVEISVQDTGIGIPSEEQGRIFERFYRARDAVEKGIPGTGLGLSIVAEIVHEHGGEIVLESQPGQGSTFTVLLPWKGRKKRILAVDDDMALIKLYSSILSNAGYEVHTAARGSQALVWLEGEKPDLILLDMVMPEMDGYQVLKKLKGNPRTRDIPVMVMTAYDVDPQKLRELEVAEFLTKPFSIPVLLDSVRRLLRTHRR